jgi:predicted amidophosphoribosyltransferase
MPKPLTRTLEAMCTTVPLPSRSSSRGFECALCRLGFEVDRLNCPACGGPVRERDHE